MLYDKHAKIEAACGLWPTEKDNRPYICTPWVDTSEEIPRLVATDSRMMAVLPVRIGENETPGGVPLEAVKAKAQVEVVLTEKEAVLTNRATSTHVPRPEAPRRYPSWQDQFKNAPWDREPDFCIDAMLLLRLADALGAPGLDGKAKSRRISVWRRGKRLYVRPLREEDPIDNGAPAQGVLMLVGKPPKSR